MAQVDQTKRRNGETDAAYRLRMEQRVARLENEEAAGLLYTITRFQRAETARRNKRAGKLARRGLPALPTVREDEIRMLYEVVGPSDELLAAIEARDAANELACSAFERLIGLDEEEAA